MKILDIFVYLIAKLKKVRFPIFVNLHLIQNSQKLALYPTPFLFDSEQFAILLISHSFIGLQEGDFGEEVCVFSEDVDVDEGL